MPHDDARRRWFQFSTRTLMIASAVVALVLVPIAWVTRERQQMLQMRDAILRAREIALASVVREEESRAKRAVAEASSAMVEDLRRQNADLRSQVEKLQHEVKSLRDQAGIARRSSH